MITARNQVVTYTGNHLITRGTGGNAVSYRFDARGNCTNVGAASAPRFFEYDPDNNLIAAHAGPTNWSFRYNAQNQMAWSQLKVNGTIADERCYLYDGLDCIAEVAPDGTLLREFIRNGAIGGIVAEKIYNDPTVPSEYRNSTLYYHYNHRGDTVSVSEGNGTHIWQSDYDAFGQPLPVQSASGAFAPRYTFSTKRYFPELGAYYYGYRWYLPELCRWMQKDPINVEMNYYKFCANNPVAYVDDYGLKISVKRALKRLANTLTYGAVVNNSSRTVYILHGDDGPQGQGHYDELPPGTATPPWDDIDGVWSDGQFYPVPGCGETIIGEDGKPVDGTPPWNGDPSSKDAPHNRGAQDNNPPDPQCTRKNNRPCQN